MGKNIEDLASQLRYDLISAKFRVQQETFEMLCQLHKYVYEHPTDTNMAAELKNILYDIIVEIFCPTSPEYDYWEPFSASDGRRVYFGPMDEMLSTIEQVYSLNVRSPELLRLISEFYDKRSKHHKYYNSRKSKRAKKSSHYQAIIRTKLEKTLKKQIDPDRPSQPEGDSAREWYRYKFLDALYRERQVRSQFFRNLQSKSYGYLHQQGYAICGLKPVSYFGVDNNDRKIDDSKQEASAYIVYLKLPKGFTEDRIQLFLDTNKYVYVYQYGSESDIHENSFTITSVDYEAEVQKVEGDTIVIRVYGNKFWYNRRKYFHALVLRDNDKQYVRQKNAVEEFSSHENPLSNFIIQQDEDSVENDIPELDWFQTLNSTQQRAVLSALQSHTFHCIHGPPGTGKTRVCAEIIAQQLHLQPSSRILVSCASNEATDNVLKACERIFPKVLHPLLLRVGTIEHTQENKHSLRYKQDNKLIRLPELNQYRNAYHKNLDTIRNREESVHRLEKKVTDLEESITELSKNLFEIKGKGRNKRRTGIRVDIEQLEYKNKTALGLSENEQDRLQKLRNEESVITKSIAETKRRILSQNAAITRFKNDISQLKDTNQDLRAKITVMEQDFQTRIINRSPLVLFSTNEFIHNYIKQFNEPFDVLVIDEITQSTEPSALIPMSVAEKVVIAGDNKQLPPTVLLKNKDYEEELDPNAEKKRLDAYRILSRSLFERLYEYVRDDARLCTFLETQYRMNPQLVPFLNETIYDDSNLIAADNTIHHEVLNDYFEKPLVFINSPPDEENIEYISEEFSESRKQYSNPSEIQVIKKIIENYLNHDVPKDCIGVVTPYRGQVRKLQHELDDYGVKVCTIDSYQGQESEIILISWVRSNTSSYQGKQKNPTERLGFLVDQRRFNVAITRFRSKLIMVGNKDTLTLSDSKEQSFYDIYDDERKPLYYRRFIQYIMDNGVFLESSQLDDRFGADKHPRVNIQKSSDDPVSPKAKENLIKRVHKTVLGELDARIRKIKREKSLTVDEKIEEMSTEIDDAFGELVETGIPDTVSDEEVFSLSQETMRFLKTGDHHYRELEEHKDLDLDWSGPVVMYSKALEKELVECFVRFRDTLREDEGYTLKLDELQDDKDFSLLVSYILKEDKKITIGNIAHFMMTARNSKSRASQYLVSNLNKYLMKELGEERLDQLITDLSEVLKYRNDPAHTESLDQTMCDNYRKRLRDILDRVVQRLSGISLSMLGF